MSWYELHERDEYPLKKKIKKVKALLEDICDELDGEDLSERDYPERDYPMDERFEERRGVRGTGRYSRYR